MKKIIKFIVFSIIFIFSLNINSADAREYHVYNEHGGWGTVLSEIAKDYIGNKTKDQIDMNGLRLAVAGRVCAAQAGGCVNMTVQEYVNKKGNNVARWIGGELHIGCGNGLLAYFNFCTSDTTPPLIYAKPDPVGYSNKPLKITLYASDSQTGINYSKYIWDYEEGTCENNGHSFSDGTKINLNRIGKYKLTLCAQDKGNECSTKNKAEWNGEYFYDPEKGYCLESTKPTNQDHMIFVNNAKVKKEYSYNDSICGYECEDGYTINFNGNGALDDTCKKVEEKSCDTSTLPDNAINVVSNPMSKNQRYELNSTECGYELPPEGFNCDESTLPDGASPTANNPTSKNQVYVLNGEECGYKLTSPNNCDVSTLPDNAINIISNPTRKNQAYVKGSKECGYDIDGGGGNGGGNYCSDTEKPTNTNNMFLIGINNANSSNQTFVYNSNSCGYVCEKDYKINKNGTPNNPKDDFCEYDTNKHCTAGVITDVCPCTLNMNKDLSVCQPATKPGEDKDPDIPSTKPGEIGILDKNLLADTYIYRIVIPQGDDESPIDYIQYKIELESGHISGIKTSHDLKFTWNMRKVDNDRLADGSREYSFYLLKICDKAGNCTTPNKEYIHKVYANTTSFGTESKSFDTSGIADGTVNNNIFILKGKYGNQVVPASGIDRTIDFNFFATNTVNQDQYTNSRNAVFVTQANKNDYANRIALGKNLNQFNNQQSDNGIYKFGFKFYAPTNTENKFKLNELSLDINGKLGNIQNYNLSGVRDFNFSPLYETEFNGEQTNGLKEGVTQTGSVIMKNINSGNESNISNKKIVLSKAGPKSENFNLSYSFENKKEGKYSSLFTLNENGFLDDFKDVLLQSGLSYTKDGNRIRYKSNYTGGNNEVLQGLKIYGNSNINKDKQRDIIRNQDKKDIHNVAGNISKSSLKKYIKRNAFNLTKGLSNGQELNGVKYFTQNGGNVEIDSDYAGTIIIKGANAYIKNNVNLGGLIVLKDNNGNGGNLYIDPSVTKIVASIYTDKSLVSYDGIKELGSNAYSSTLNKQLYIYGSVFSENTIGGSRKNPLVCPYYLYGNSDFVCDIEESQKYDLNYLRRGFENKSDVNLGDFPVIIKYNPAVQTNPPKGFTK